jgi:3-hydroxy acid dehydrogenase / malonic semialdehyde reductase
MQQTVMITGASAGFGTAIARLFAREGARLILLARRKERLEALKQELQQAYQTEIYLIQADVTDFEKLSSLIPPLIETFGLPTILINNAGMVRGMDKVWEMAPDQWNEMIDTNIKGILNVTRLILPSMREVNQGQIINRLLSKLNFGVYILCS